MVAHVTVYVVQELHREKWYALRGFDALSDAERYRAQITGTETRIKDMRFPKRAAK